ncbi:MAG: nitrous oxide reductase family maturation protein NosD, partial [Promethearchaeota archaeon]
KELNILIFLTLVTLFILSSMFYYDLSINSVYSTECSEYNDNINLDYDILQLSKVSGRIHINNNWSEAIDAGICTGNGTYSEPYIIRDWVITTFPESGILIENSNAYLIIENCTIGHAADPNAGIELVNVNNSQIINNDCSLNYHGIYLRYCNNNTISGNIASDAESFGYTLSVGIYLKKSNNNIISGNTANYTGSAGISLYKCNHNVISGNTANICDSGIGISLAFCDNNIISGNTANDGGTPSWNGERRRADGIYLGGCENNIITGNNVNGNSEAGIILSSSNYNTISGNIANNNNYGIWFLRLNTYNDASENVIGGNVYRGVYLTEQSNHNVISGNALSGNGMCIEEYDCIGNIYWNNGLCIYIGAPYFEILIYTGGAALLILIVVLAEIQRRKTHRL